MTDRTSTQSMLHAHVHGWCIEEPAVCLEGCSHVVLGLRETVGGKTPIDRLQEAPMVQDSQSLHTQHISLARAESKSQLGSCPASVPNPRPGNLWFRRKGLSLTGKCRDLPCPLTQATARREPA